MSSRSDGIPRVYVVFWPENGVFKVGSTAKTRWKTFTNRGATIVALYEFDSFSEALLVEAHLHESARALYPRAFEFPDGLAADLLGHGASGYLECYLGTLDDASAVISHAVARGLAADAQA